MSLPVKTATAVQISQPPRPPPLILAPPNQSHFKPTFASTLRHKNKPINSTVAWTSSIARHCRNGQLAEAAAEFTRMRLAGVEPNHITLITLLSACADFPLNFVTFGYGVSVHGYARKLGLDENDVIVGTALVDMYAKFGQLGMARSMFDQMGVKNSVSWNTMIDGCMRNGEVEDALHLFDQMPVRDPISWTALIGGFVKKECYEEALECFRQMQLSGVAPDYVTVIAVLAACSNLGLLNLGLWVNRFIIKYDFKDNVRICNSLIDMYSRCGCIGFAFQVFEKMRNRTSVSWNSIIVGMAINGHAEEALNLFNLMQNEGLVPNEVSFTGALTACSHAGLVDEGLQLFDSMERVHRITPRIEHYGCVVDLYSRTGRLEEALDFIKKMPMKPNEVVLGSLLAACRTQGDVRLAERLMNYLVEIDPSGDSNYILLSNTYAALGRWDGANNVRREMKARGIQKTPGFSSIEIGCGMHWFVAGDKSHSETEHIYTLLNLLSVELNLWGYVPETNARESNEDD